MTAAKRNAKSSVGVYGLPPLPDTFSCLLDLGGVAGATGQRRVSTGGVTARDGPIDVDDSEFRRGLGVWGKWEAFRTDERTDLQCGLCHGQLDTTVS